MTIICIATGDALTVLRYHDGYWQATLQLAGLPTQCVSAKSSGLFLYPLWKLKAVDHGTGPMF